jgi:hypothetical protein
MNVENLALAAMRPSLMDAAPTASAEAKSAAPRQAPKSDYLAQNRQLTPRYSGLSRVLLVADSACPSKAATEMLEDNQLQHQLAYLRTRPIMPHHLPPMSLCRPAILKH